MLKQRVITACVMVAVLLLLLFWAPPALFCGAIVLLCALSAWEWTNLAGFSAQPVRVLYAVVLAAMLAVAAYVMGVSHGVLPPVVLLLVMLGWCVAFGVVLTYPACRRWCKPPILAGVGVWLLLPCFYAVLYLKFLRPDGGLVLLVIAVVAAADTGAYFAGKRFGRHKLAPAVSPGKTWEGFAGGMLASSVLALAVSAMTSVMPPMWLLLACVATAASSVVGDLFESLVKRERGVKDSGQLLPGHGGVLDRLDGWMPAFPMFALIYGWVGQ